MTILRRSSLLTLLALLLLPAALAGCGGDDGDDEAANGGDTAAATEETGGGSATGDATAGKQVFAEAGCGNCHTLAAADASGQRAPNLDERIPEIEERGDDPMETVVEQVTNGSEPGEGNMPAFKDKLSEQQIQDVAAFVVESAGQ